MLSRLAAGLVITGTGFGVCELVAAQDRPPDVQAGVQVQTRGPVHEAFAETVSFNPEPGTIVTKAPPPQIEEVPPDQRPEGANVAWIPGYWAWDDELTNFLWVSGVWRAMPPDREWVPGYWGKVEAGYQWMSGYWADAQVNETVYLPEPPDSVEAGPNVAQPAPDQIWAPGCWVWHEGRYAWRPGYWVAVQPEWMWVPSHYVYSPRGYVYCEGYWDYPIESRGVLFAPVYFEPAVYARPAFHYSPLITINLSVFFDHLFVRPSCHHYYFGDYYAPRYYDEGIYASFTFNYSRYGYDPIHVNERYRHRDDPEWDHQVRQNFLYRRDHEEARPPRTMALQVALNTASKEKPLDRSLAIAAPLDQIAKSKDHPIKLQPVAKEEKLVFEKSERDVEASRGERKNLEAPVAIKPVAQPSGKPDAAKTDKTDNKPDSHPDKPDSRPDNTTRPDNTSHGAPDVAKKPDQAKRPKAPIAARPADQLNKSKAPPKRPEPPKPDPKIEGKPRQAGGRPDPPQAGPKENPRDDSTDKSKDKPKGKP